MVFLAGVDEAGYGPFVGPFTVGFSLFRVPEFDTDLWPLLNGPVVRKAARGDPRVRVDDSKRVHQGRLGRGRLERSVAAFREVLHPGEDDVHAWLEAAPAGPGSWVARSPWLSQLSGRLCPSVSRERTRLDAAAIGRALRIGGCTLDAFGSRAVPAGEWNDWIERTRNKGETLFHLTMEVVRHLLERTGDAPLRIELDRHGGRRSYGSRLQKALQPQRLIRHGETGGGSTYTLVFADREVQLRFSEGADQKFFCVSLASLAAKQTRERCMDAFNQWWLERLPQVAATKGYGVDGKRWLAETAELAAAFGVDEAVLRRTR